MLIKRAYFPLKNINDDDDDEEY